MGWRLMPQETTYPAVGTVLVHDVAKRDVLLEGNEVQIGRPEEEQFWSNFAQFVGSTEMLRTAAEAIGVSAEEATGQLEPASLQPIRGSDAARVSAAAIGVPRTGMAPNVSNAKDLAVRYCDAFMEHLGEEWRARRIRRLELARHILQERQPLLKQEVAQIRREADALIAEYEGVPPTGVLDSLTQELAAVEEQMAAAQVAKGTAEARSDVLAGRERPRMARVEGEETSITNPRVVALEQAIVEKQIQLDEELARRTEEHQQVRALKVEIERLQERLREVKAEAEQEVGPAAAAVMAETAVTAQVEAEALTRRLELLQERMGEIRARLPTVRADARVYEEVAGRLAGAEQAYATLLDSLDRLDAEEEQLGNPEVTLVEVVDEAEPERVPRGLAAFVGRLAVAVLAGGGLGILLIFVLHYVDFSFQDEEEAERMLGVRVLAGIPRSDVEFEPVEAVTGEPEQDETDADAGLF
ncbi:MAG: hypothetical protein U9R79_15175 [Armatimonadota bacterium]|nr:hypothetical protein [Armatimonadota bacterium]